MSGSRETFERVQPLSQQIKRQLGKICVQNMTDLFNIHSI